MESSGVAFGSISSVDVIDRGRIAVLDGVNCTLRIFDSDGTLLSTAAGRGSGPGELQLPMDMAVLSSGEIAVSDWGAWGISFYSNEPEYLRFLGPMPGGSPMALAPGAGNTLIGLGLSFFDENGESAGEYFLASWSDSVSPSFKFFQGRASVIPGEAGELEISFPDVVFDCSPRGETYAALSTDSTFEVSRFSPEGDETPFISRDVEKAPLPDEMASTLETQEEADGETGAIQIAGIYCEGDSLVWIRLGNRACPFFEVYDYQGNLRETIECPGIMDPFLQLDLRIRNGEYYAWDTNPPDYPRIYRLELQREPL